LDKIEVAPLSLLLACYQKKLGLARFARLGEYLEFARSRANLIIFHAQVCILAAAVSVARELLRCCEETPVQAATIRTEYIRVHRCK